jgi:hypothetical protein
VKYYTFKKHRALQALKAMNPIRTAARGKVIPATGSRGSWLIDTSRLPHFQDNLLTDGGKVVGLTGRPLLPGKFLDTNFY